MIGHRAMPLASTQLVAWNVRGFRPRAQEVDNLFTDPSVDIAFLSETMQGRYKDGTIAPLDFRGTKISMPGLKDRDTSGHPSMGLEGPRHTWPSQYGGSICVKERKSYPNRVPARNKQELADARCGNRQASTHWNIRETENAAC